MLTFCLAQNVLLLLSINRTPTCLIVVTGDALGFAFGFGVGTGGAAGCGGGGVIASGRALGFGVGTDDAVIARGRALAFGDRGTGMISDRYFALGLGVAQVLDLVTVGVLLLVLV